MATELGIALAAKGHTVHFISYDLPVRLSEYRKNIYYHEVRVSDYPLFDYPPYELVLASKLVDVARYEKLDILHVHYAIPHASAALMARQILAKKGIRIPFITTLHGTDITLVGKDPSFEPVITFAIEESDGVTAVSESLRNDTYEHFRVKRDIQVIPNFICLEHYKPGNNTHIKQDYAPNGERILCHTSNFRKVKRIMDTVKVFANVRKEMPAKLLLVGDGPERQIVESECRQNELCDDIVFLGKMNDPEDILAISDLFLLTSETESFGLAALEAMASAVPVISTNAGGIPEVNEHGYSGYMSDVGDIENMTLNALKILKDDATLAQFKENALEQARKFDVNSILPQYEAVYNSVLEPVGQ